MVQRGLSDVAVLVRRARTDAHGADNLARYDQRQSSANDHETTPDRGIDAIGRGAGLACRAIFVGRLFRCGRRLGLVYGNGDAGDLAAIHALEGNQIAGGIGDGDTHWHADFGSPGAGAFQQSGGIVEVEIRCHSHGDQLRFE